MTLLSASPHLSRLLNEANALPQTDLCAMGNALPPSPALVDPIATLSEWSQRYLTLGYRKDRSAQNCWDRYCKAFDSESIPERTYASLRAAKVASSDSSLLWMLVDYELERIIASLPDGMITVEPRIRFGFEIFLEPMRGAPDSMTSPWEEIRYIPATH